MDALIDFSGKKIVVAGASSGIGRQTAVMLSGLGAQVVAIARREEKLIETLQLLEGTGHSYYVSDLGVLDEISELFERISEEQGALAGLVYCTGISQNRPLKIAKPAYTEEIMRVNFLAFWETVRQFAKKGRYEQNAKIVGISSVASVRPGKGQGIYAASKAAMDAAVLVLAQELQKEGIMINTIRPGWVKTELLSQFYDSHENAEELIYEAQPLGPIEPNEIAKMAAYLLSPYAQHITGSHVEISGGYLSKGGINWKGEKEK